LAKSIGTRLHCGHEDRLFFRSPGTVAPQRMVAAGPTGQGLMGCQPYRAEPTPVLSVPVERWVGFRYPLLATLEKNKDGCTVDGDTLDDEKLGHAVDAWLATLRARGLSERRLGELARLLGEAMSENEQKSLEQARVLKRFKGWQANH
jgi:hypothetical protein